MKSKIISNLKALIQLKSLTRRVSEKLGIFGIPIYDLEMSDRQTHRQTDRHTDTQTERQIN